MPQSSSQTPPANSAERVIRASWVLPFAGADSADDAPSADNAPSADGAPIADGAVAFANGTIVEVGEAQAIIDRHPQAEHLALAEHVLMPGLVNAHGHAAMTLLRGSSEDAPLQEWLSRKIWPLEAKWVDEAFCRDGIRIAMAEMIRAGVTCFADMYYFPEIGAEEAKRAGLRAQLAFPVIEFPNAWSRDSEEGFHKGLGLYDQYRNDPFIDIAFGPHAPYTVTEPDLEKILMYSEELDANIHIHLHENAAELAENESRYGTSGIRHLYERGLLGPRLQAVHVTQITPEEIALFAETNVQVVHCPTSNAKLASGTCPVTDLRAAGINVCLGTDGAASNNVLDLLGEARLASLLAKLEQANAAALPAHDALYMATLGGASALGRERETGSLEPGKAADLIALDMQAIRHQPLYDPVAQVLHTSSGTSVSHVWVNGECLLDDGVLVRMDEQEIRQTARIWQQRIRPR
jgi:5-methylthioadenosine/S-adenosylhomocysteine deaminase